MVEPSDEAIIGTTELSKWRNEGNRILDGINLEIIQLSERVRALRTKRRAIARVFTQKTTRVPRQVKTTKRPSHRKAK